MTRYRIIREAEHSIIDGRAKFFRDEDGIRPLCQVIADSFRGSGSDQAATEEAKKLRNETHNWSKVPWLTPVFGSGCLDVGEAAAVDRQAMTEAVTAMAAVLPTVPLGSEPWETIAGRFTDSLIRQRRANESRPALGSAVAVGELAVRLVLIAALLTRFCHAVRAIDPIAIGRRPDEQVTLTRDTPIDDPFDLGVTVVVPLRALLHDLAVSIADEHADDDVIFSAVDALARSILDDLNQAKPTANLHSVRLATEAAWYFLVSGEPGAEQTAYYGWTETLLGLILKESSSRSGASFRRLRPRFTNLNSMSKAVALLFKGPTETSWGRLSPDAPATSAASIHAAMAEVLHAQAQAADDNPALTVGDTIPLPVAFSTSFDLELEMALWRRGRPFSVALPVHISRDENANDVTLCWLLGDVDPVRGRSSIEALRELRRPVRWRPTSLVGRAAETDATAGHSGSGPLANGRSGRTGWRDDEPPPTRPIVVRLTGSPLINLDCLAPRTQGRKRLAEWLQPHVGLDDECDIQPAVSVDEYLALRQAEVELFWAVNQNVTDDSGAAGLGLSHRLTDAGGERRTNHRYWMVLGVPMGDRAVRHRVMSPLAARWIRASAGALGDLTEGVQQLRDLRENRTSSGAGGAGKDRTAPESFVGTAVNSHIDEDEALFLSWLGLSVVRDDCRKFAEDLEHYARHVSATDEHQRRLDSRECRL